MAFDLRKLIQDLLTAEEFAGAQTVLDLPRAQTVIPRPNVAPQGQSPALPRKAKPRAPGPWADMGREPSQVQSPLISAEQRAAAALRTEQLLAILRRTQARTPNIADLKLPEFMGENVPMSDPRLQNVPVIQPGPAEYQSWVGSDYGKRLDAGRQIAQAPSGQTIMELSNQIPTNIQSGISDTNIRQMLDLPEFAPDKTMVSSAPEGMTLKGPFLRRLTDVAPPPEMTIPGNLARGVEQTQRGLMVPMEGQSGLLENLRAMLEPDQALARIPQSPARPTTPAGIEPQGVRPGFPPQRPQLGAPMERGLARAETLFPRNTPEGVVYEPRGVRPGFTPDVPQLGPGNAMMRPELSFNPQPGLDVRGVRPGFSPQQLALPAVAGENPTGSLPSEQMTNEHFRFVGNKRVPPVYPGQAEAQRAAMLRAATQVDVPTFKPTMVAEVAPTMDANTQIPKLDTMTQRMPSEALTRNAGGPPNRPMPPGPGAGQSLLSILGALGTGMGAVETKRHLEQGRWQEALATGIPTGAALAAARNVLPMALRAAMLNPYINAAVNIVWPQGTATNDTFSDLPPDHPDRIRYEQGWGEHDRAKVAKNRAKVAEDRAIESARQSYGVLRATRTDDGSDPKRRMYRYDPINPVPGEMLDPNYFDPAPKKPAPRPVRRSAPTPVARTYVGEVMPSFDLGGPTMRLPEREPMGLGVPDLQLGKRQVLRPDKNESEVSSDDFEQSLMDLELLKQLKRQMGGAVTKPGFSGRGPDNLPFYPR